MAMTTLKAVPFLDFNKQIQTILTTLRWYVKNKSKGNNLFLPQKPLIVIVLHIYYFYINNWILFGYTMFLVNYVLQ